MKLRPRYSNRVNVLNPTGVRHWVAFARVCGAYGRGETDSRLALQEALKRVETLAVVGPDRPENPCHTLRGYVRGIVNFRGPAIDPQWLVYYSDLVLKACDAGPAPVRKTGARQKAARPQKGAVTQNAS